MMNVAAPKTLLISTSDFITSSSSSSSSSTIRVTHFRPLKCAASSSVPNYRKRLVSDPPDLIKWVREEGGFVHNGLKITDDGYNGLGLVASEDIQKGSDLIALPSNLQLQFQSLDSDDEDEIDSVLIQLAANIPEEQWAMKLGLKLLRERATAGSFWWPYISNLPQTYSVPIYFPPEDIADLQYAPLLRQVELRFRFLLEFEREITLALENVKPYKHPFGGQEIDASSLDWAMSAVSSRAFRLHGKRLQDGTHDSIPMMLPLIDMCNHSFHPNAQIVQEEDTNDSNVLVKVKAETHIKQNDPVVLNYGCLSNDCFLIDYGFVVPSNPYDTMVLRYAGSVLDAASKDAGVTSTKFSSPTPWQQQFLSQLNLHEEASDLKVILGGSDLVEGRLVAALRGLLASDMESLKKHNLNTLKSLSAEAPLGLSNEIAALRILISFCLIGLGCFATDIMEDEALLRKSESHTTELALQFRIQKKSMIIDLIRELTRRVKFLSSKKQQLTKLRVEQSQFKR